MQLRNNEALESQKEEALTGAEKCIKISDIEDVDDLIFKNEIIKFHSER